MNTCMHVHSYAKEELCEAALISAQLLLLYTICIQLLPWKPLINASTHTLQVGLECIHGYLPYALVLLCLAHGTILTLVI